ncbi:MAG: hypothetical protein AB7R77_21165 [Ilumatobacteraceae bacterium]
MIIGFSRRVLADKLGHPDTSAGIPEARWMRAMTFERLVEHERFVSQLLTTAVGALGLARPDAVRRADGHVSAVHTAKALQQAHLKAVHENVATMITGLGVPFVGMEADPAATLVKPDFAIVAPRTDGTGAVVGTWLIMGDAKDYERVRSRIDDQRMLKGFLQVALGAESAAAWSALPDGMIVHASGALAVPRNAFLQPEAVVERLDDHRREVRARVDERTQLLAQAAGDEMDEAAVRSFVGHLQAAFDPSSCSTCAMFNFCRSELRASTDPLAVLIELGVRPELRAAVAGCVDGSGNVGRAPETLVANVRATVTGLPQWTGQRRIDPVGLPGTINIVLAKADAAALGVHGIGWQRVTANGSVGPWSYRVFDDPQSPSTRLAIMRLVGAEIGAAFAEFQQTSPMSLPPVHLVIPDAATGDVLVSIADSLAGVETSRMRWQRDLDMGRKPLTFDGEPAVVPAALSASERLAVSFLLEEDRARAMSLRWPLIDLRTVLMRHLVAGGPTVDSGRLDYLVTWAEAASPHDHRIVSDAFAANEHTPGARLSNTRSDAIHLAGRGRGSIAPDPARYEALVSEELAYKAATVDRALAVLAPLQVSLLRQVHLALEADAQAVWRARLHLHASDLVRFGRTNWLWRNSQVVMLDDDAACALKLLALGNPKSALDMALDAGTREVATATVTAVNPVRLRVQSRRLRAGSCVVAVQITGQPCVEAGGTTLKIQKGSFKFGGFSLGELTADDQTAADESLLWTPRLVPAVSVGDELVVANVDWLGGTFKSGHEIAIERPKPDTMSAPKDGCHDGSYASDPENHKYCCRSHEDAEAEWSDQLAERRERGELNPQAWPPVIDEDQFDTPAAGSPTADDATDPLATGPAEHLTIDDVD